MLDKDELKEEILIDEKEAKKRFLEELRSKNMEQTKKIENNDEAEQITDEESLSTIDKEASEQIGENEKASVDEKTKFQSFKKSFKVSLIDTAVSAILSVAGVYLFDLILRLLFGYFVVDFKGIYIIIFLIILVIYPAIMQNSKEKQTIGEKLSKNIHARKVE
ncbi:hypothetical protein [Clostridium sp. DJ247]|uniref:hypothetical protein n=1 Tax=Clostridium sp. DJ247 TaxID=2726188 RepID=UPI00162A6580|nr:hypothetical protein [Clostridium sp. DJ247]MBC2581590.1 hypothetical protein [Clostridium sp. DJ247]